MASAAKKRRISVTAILLALVITGSAAAATLALAADNNAEDGSASYREYKLQSGDVTVGTAESGTVALTRTVVSFPVDAAVSEILVSPGESVKEGQALVRLDAGSITDGSAESLSKLNEAKFALEQAVNDQATKLQDAKTTYSTSVAEGSLAQDERSITQMQIQNDITAAQQELDDAKETLAEYQALQTSYPTDYATLNERKTWMDEAQKLKDDYEEQLSAFETEYSTELSRLSSLESDRDKAKTAVTTAEAEVTYIEKSGEGDVDEAESALETAEYNYEVAKQAYTTYYNKTGEAVLSEQEKIGDQVAQYTAELENYTDAYNDFKETFDETYKGSGENASKLTAKDIATKVTTQQTAVEKAELALQKAQTTAKISEAEAEQKLQSSLNEAGAAQSVYQSTAEQLEQTVASKQSSYHILKTQLKDLENAINGNGVVSSPADGIVVSVGCAAGDDVPANQTMVSISKPSEVSMSISVSEEDVTAVTLGQEAAITLTAYEGQSFPAKVTAVNAEPARSGSSSVSYTVTVKMDGENTNQLYDGMSGEVTLIQAQKNDVLYINNSAVQFENGTSTVLVKQADGTGKETEVETGFSNGRYVEVISGLSEGDTVLVESAVKAE